MRKIIIWLLLLPFVSNAQPGYMGKKMSIGYEFETMPWLCNFSRTLEYYDENASYYQSYDAEKFMQFTQGHHLHFAKVTSRKNEVFVNGSFRPMTYYLNPVYVDGVGELLPTRPYMKALETYLDIGIRHYPSDFICPVGLYHQFSFGFCTVKTSENELPLEMYVSDYERKEIELKSEEYKCKRFNYGFGVKRIISGPVFINGEVNVHWVFQSSENRRLAKIGQEIDEEQYVMRNLLLNFNSYKLLDMRLGIGVLF